MSAQAARWKNVPFGMLSTKRSQAGAAAGSSVRQVTAMDQAVEPASSAANT